MPARGARGAQGAHRRARRGFAARPPQGRRGRADRLAVLYPAGSEGRQAAAHRARSHPRHPKELGLPAEPQDGGPELGSRYRPRNTARLRSKADATRVSTGAVLDDVVFAAPGQDARREPEHLSLYDYSIPSAQSQWVQGLPRLRTFSEIRL